MNDQDVVWHIADVRIIDPFRRVDIQDEIFIADGRIVSRDWVRQSGRQSVSESFRGLWLVPRLTDMHVHFRDPGQEWKEDIASGSRAAAHGGFTVVATMPNTTPAVDQKSLVEWQIQLADSLGLVHLHPIGAISRGLKGQELAELYQMKEAGAVAFSDDGRSVTNSRLMRTALSYSVNLARPMIQHAEDMFLSKDTVMHEGIVSHRLGLSGVPDIAESVIVWRDVELAGLTGGLLHVAHVSAPGSLEAVASAQRRGYHVTAEAAPHHLYLTDEAVKDWDYRPVTKVNPPLRPKNIQEALIRSVQEGIISVIASDHAPHHADEKNLPYDEAPYGISGLETSLATVMTVFLEKGLLSPLDLFSRMTLGPDKVLGLGYQGLTPGASADLTVIDPEDRWEVDPKDFYSKGKNTPLAGHTLNGRARATMCRGRWTMRDGEVLL